MKLTLCSYQNEEDYWQIRQFLRQVMICNGRREFCWHVARLDYWWWFINADIEKITPEESIFLWQTEDGQIAAVLNPEGRGDLKIAVVAPSGDFVALCGMFYEPINRYAYVEPVATDPDYRRMGLGSAAVLEGIRRCGELGATVAYVGSDQEFYLSLGFEVIYNSECWVKDLEV